MVASRHVDPFACGSEYSTGVLALDTEHRYLYELILELQTNMENGVDDHEQSALLHLIAENAAMHFASEEAMMAQNHYSGLGLHRMKHEDLLQKLGGFVVHFDHGAKLNHHSMQFLRDWLLVHVRDADRLLGRWLIEHTGK